MGRVDAVALESFGEVLGEIRSNIGDQRYDLWFKDVRFLSLYRGTLTIGVPNLFYQDWIKENYSSLLSRTAHDVLGIPVRIDVKVDPELYRKHRQKVHDAELLATLDEVGETRPANSTLETFVTVPENELAVRSLRHVVNGVEPRLNPLILVGPPGVGKTHLLLACNGYVGGRQASRPRVLHLTAIEFTNRFTMSLKMKVMDRFRASFEGHDLVAFDEIHRLRGKKATQKQFLSLIKTLLAEGVQVVLASRHHPREIDDLDPVLQSMFMTGMLAEIRPYSTDSLALIVAAGHTADQAIVPRPVLQRVAENAAGNVRDLKTRLLRIYAYASLIGEEVTPDFVRRHADELNHAAGDGTEDYDTLIAGACDVFGVSRDDLLSKRKSRSLSVPRGLIVYVLRNRHKLTFKEIGRILGGRSHTSVFIMHKKYAVKVPADVGLRDIASRLPGPGLSVS